MIDYSFDMEIGSNIYLLRIHVHGASVSDGVELMSTLVALWQWVIQLKQIGLNAVCTAFAYALL